MIIIRKHMYIDGDVVIEYNTPKDGFIIGCDGLYHTMSVIQFGVDEI